MPSIPQTQNLSARGVDILNAIRNNASTNYRDYVPVATEDAQSLKTIGAIIMNYEALQNEFLSALINRIGRVIVTSKSYQNPWKGFKKGFMEFGETVEEVFVNLAKPFAYDPAVAETEVFKREIPDVRAAFHILNYQKFYKVTIQNEQLRQAFLSWSGITDLITKITESMYTAANYDEFQVMKYMLARNILNGRLYPVTIPEVSADNAKGITAMIKGLSNNMEFMSTNYNAAGVHTYSAKREQYLIVNANFDAVMDVEVLAAAFHMDKAEFEGHRILVDSFGNLDSARLEQLFEDDDNYEEIDEDEAEALNAIPAVLVDKDWFMILDNMMKFTEQYNGQGLYWNYWYHVWKTFSVSPFANAAVFIPGEPAITYVGVSPALVTAMPGSQVNLRAIVNTENFAPQTVNWTSSDEDTATVDIHGTVTIADDAVAETEVTITATSTFDSEFSGTSTITVSGSGSPD